MSNSSPRACLCFSVTGYSANYQSLSIRVLVGWLALVGVYPFRLL